MMSKEDKFKKLVDENSAQIERICSYYSKNAEDRKDMYQEILINIWKSLDNYRGEAAISTWIYRIAVNTSLTFTGKSIRRLKLHVDEGTKNLNLLVSEDTLPEKEKQEQQYEQLEIAVNQLSIIDKTLITLVLEGLSVKEIADVVGITMPNVKVKVHRIKEHLKEQLN
jgi:RNA polymerase sigma-70 factor (ECF subfamily)